MADTGTTAWILGVMRANNMHEAECADMQSPPAAPFADCDCWLSRPPGSGRSTWNSWELAELTRANDGVLVDEYSNIAGASRRYTWPDGRVRCFERNRGDLFWTEVFDNA